jgi:siroheme synthase
VTHRGLASGFAVLSGHAEAAYGPILEAIAPGSLTLVVLMGLAARARVAGFLLDRGWAAETPAAILAGASTGAAWSWLGPLRDLGAAPAPPGADAPATLCVGRAVGLSAVLGSDRARVGFQQFAR